MTDLPEAGDYEVRIYDAGRGRRLVAVVEIVSPSNKDRPEHRRAFVARCAALLREEVSVTIVDLVTVRASNLYHELLDYLGLAAASAAPTTMYAVACRLRPTGGRQALEAWNHPLEIGRPLPVLPLWPAPDLAVPLDLEEGYEAACRALRIP